MVAERQEGVLGIDQLGSIGAHGDHWRRAKRSGRWEPLSRRVLKLAGAPLTESVRVHAALLDAGGSPVLHGPSTLAWFGLRSYDLSSIHAVRRRGTTSAPCELATVHRVRDLSDRDVTVFRGVPTMTPLRAIWSEASRWPGPRLRELGEKRIGRLLDDANTKRLLTWDQLHESVDRLGRRGRAGTSIMRAAACRRPPGTAPTESGNEDRLEEILEHAGVPPLRRQVPVGGAAPIGRTDYRDPDLGMVAEVNSIAFHSLPSDQDADELRYQALIEAGFCVVVVWETALWSAPRSVRSAVAEGRRRARRGDLAVVHTLGCPWPADPDRIVIGEIDRPYRG